MGIVRKLDTRYGDNAIWQFVKFNLVSTSVTAVQLALANLLPFLFDGVTKPLPVFLQKIFDPAVLFDGPSPYVVNGAVRGSGSRAGLTAYLVILTALILFSTWLQGYLNAKLAVTPLALWGRTIAAMAAGLVQVAVLFPLEKFVLFRKK